MTKSDEKTKILCISNNPLIVESIDATFREDHSFELVDRSILAQGVLPAIAEIVPELILLDFEYKKEETYELVDKIATQFPAVAVVVILPETKVQFSDKVILAGARAFILYPFTQKNLLATTHIPVGEIGKMVGIDDPYYFSRIFKRKYHMTPTRYRGMISLPMRS